MSNMQYEVKELTVHNRADAEFVIRSRFPAGAVYVLDKVMRNPIRDEHAGFGDILYVGGKPVAFRAALRRKIYIQSTKMLARVRGLTCRLPNSPKDSIQRLIEAQKQNPRGCSLAISNTQCVPTEKRAVMNGATLGPATCKRFIWRPVRPLGCLVYFLRRRLLGLTPRKCPLIRNLESDVFSEESSGLQIRRLTSCDMAFFDELMSRYLASNEGVVSSRSAEEIEWIYGDKIRTGAVVVLGAFEHSLPIGYLLLKANPNRERWLIGDLFAVGNSPSALSALLKAGCSYLKMQTPAMLLESIGFPAHVEPVLRRFLPFTRSCNANFDSFNFFSKDDALQYGNLILSEKSWFFGPYDGDMCLDE